MELQYGVVTFEWDEAKNRANLRKHGFDFQDVRELFQGPILARLDTRRDYGEDRWQGIGILQGRIVVVVFTEREPGTIRIISLRKATSHERNAFETAIQD